MEPTELFTQAEVAKRLRISQRTLERWRSEPPAGVVLPHVKMGSRVVYRGLDIEIFIAAQIRQNTSDTSATAEEAAS